MRRNLETHFRLQEKTSNIKQSVLVQGRTHYGWKWVNCLYWKMTSPITTSQLKAGFRMDSPNSQRFTTQEAIKAQKEAWRNAVNCLAL